jgi:hypothetical protein
MAKSTKKAFGGKQAPPFGKKEDTVIDKEKEKVKTAAKPKRRRSK